ncbi:ABC transporter ATP-binding protein [Chloroflexus aggregans]|uniref:ABC transporter related n=1 Tax=Chloroflexus aggregans (strain MD-66 / DSM 9485) TaxID=326427 RepID=B8GAV0_CHLAD|nr:ABC transporter ATP-binding protein [Chloroflexus aggregans]ACL24689.1 ABC transporter related [Chloroflexus aggregans DSM 9485]
MIEAIQLGKQFGDFVAVRDLTLTVQPGELVALLGPNGAGKTTTVRMLAAILPPSSGQARICGYDVVRDAQRVRGMVGLLTEYPGLYGRMAALEYLAFFGALLGLDAVQCRQRSEALLRQFGLWEVRDRNLESFSKGMRQKMALIRAMIHDPPVLFLDEPTTAMDPQSARTVRDAIGELRGAKRSILLTTHNLSEAEELADRIAIIRGGQIVAVGPFAELSRQLLGDPAFELIVARPADQARALAVVRELVAAEVVGHDRIVWQTAEPHLLNPAIVNRLITAGIAVYSLSEQPRRLEDLYLRIVAEDEAVPALSARG